MQHVPQSGQLFFPCRNAKEFCAVFHRGQTISGVKLFRICFNNRIKKRIGRHYRALLRHKLDHAGVIAVDLSRHGLLMAGNKIIKCFCVLMDGIFGFLIDFGAGVFFCILFKRCNDLFFQISILQTVML